MKKLSLSVVLITKNESANIKRCLDSVQWADEILVVDSGSTDNTKALAAENGARVLEESWRGFGPQKAFAAKAAKHDWILSLDADEIVTKELQSEIANRLETLDPKSAYRIPRLSYFLGKAIRHGGWYPDRQTRLFNRKFAMWDSAVVHEKVDAAQFESLSQNLEHFVFRDVAHQMDTNNRYSGLLAEKDFAAGKRSSLFKLITKPTVKFIENYIWKLGFLDGRAGYVIAVGSAVSIFLRLVKLAELEKRG